MANAAKKPETQAPEHARDYCGIAQQWAEDIVAGRIVSGLLVKQACQRHLSDLQRPKNILWPYWFDRWHGDDICDFIEKLPHVEGQWETPYIRLEAPQIFMLTTVFGWRRDGNYRRFSTCYLEMARKAAKALAHDTRVPTPSGMVNHGDLQIGDFVYGSNGRSTRVIGVTETFLDRECFAVEFSTGEKIVASGEHLWPVVLGDGPVQVLDTQTIQRALRTTCVSSPQIGMAGRIPDYRREIVSVEHVPSVPVKCIQVANEDGIYLVSESYIPTHNSTLTAGVALYCLTCENEVGPQIIIGATTGEQAGKVFNPAKAMVDKLPDLQEAFGLSTLTRAIVCRANNGGIQPINAKGKTQDGWNPHVGILDELHAHKDRSLFDVIKSAFGARKNPLFWIITTAGFDTNGVCYEQRSTAVKMLSGAVKLEHLFALIFTLDEKDDPYDERNWPKANPMIGVTPTWEKMRSDAADAKVSPNEEGNFKTKNLNIWMNAASAWLNITQWNKCADPSLKWEDFEGLDCYIGGDLADKDDITALALCAIDKTGRLLVKPKFWLPEAVLSHPDHAEGRGNAPYRTWSNRELIEPFLNLTPGDWVDHGEVEKVVRDWIDRFRVRKVTFDQFAAAQLMATRLNEDYGTPEKPIAQILHKNAKNVSDPAKDLETRVKAGEAKFCHDGNPVMTWMAANCVVSRRRDETLLPIKESQMSKNKIDGIDAIINAIQPLSLVQAKEVKPSYQVIFVG